MKRFLCSSTIEGRLARHLEHTHEGAACPQTSGHCRVLCLSSQDGIMLQTVHIAGEDQLTAFVEPQSE